MDHCPLPYRGSSPKATGTVSWLVEAGAPIWHHAWRNGLLEGGLAALVTPAVFAFLAWEQRLLGLA